MSLSERIERAQGGTVTLPHRTHPMADGLADFKVGISNILFERLGQRLFETQDAEGLRTTVVAEIKAILDTEEAPLTEEERQRLVQEIARDVMALGPIEPFLADVTVTEIMVNGTD